MHDDVWYTPDETPQDAPGPRRSTAVRVARVLVVAAAFATVGAGGVAAASTGGNPESVTPNRVVVHHVVDNASLNSSAGTAAQHDCPFHSQQSSAQG